MAETRGEKHGQEHNLIGLIITIKLFYEVTKVERRV